MAGSDFVLFVSHVSEDRGAAMEIVAELERRGVPCWIAPRNVRPGRPFDDEIAAAIDASRAMLLIFSDRCNESEYIRREITVAGESQKIIIPFRIEDAHPRRGLRVRLSDLHWIDGFVSRERAIEELTEELGGVAFEPAESALAGTQHIAPDQQRRPPAPASDHRWSERKWTIFVGVVIAITLATVLVLGRSLFFQGPFQDNNPPREQSPHDESARTLTGHTDRVESVAFSPKGAVLASGSRDKTIRIWEIASGHLLRTLRGNAETIYSVAFSPDGRLIASGSDDGIKLWDAETGQVLRAMSGSDDATAVAFSPNGHVLASGDYDKNVKLWDVANGHVLATAIGHTNHVEAIAFSPDGSTVASASDDKTIKLWDAANGQLLRTLEGHTKLVEFVAFSPDGKTVASASDDGTAKVWDLGSGQTTETFDGHNESVLSLAFSPDGKILATGSHDHNIKLWNTSDGEELRTLRGHTEAVRSVAFSPDGRTLASGSEDHTVKLWDVSN